MIRKTFALVASWLSACWTFGTLFTVSEPFMLSPMASILAGGIATLPSILVTIQISGNQGFCTPAIASSGFILLVLCLQPSGPHPAGALCFISAGVYICRHPAEIRALGVHQLRRPRKPGVHFQDPGKPHLN